MKWTITWSEKWTDYRASANGYSAHIMRNMDTGHVTWGVSKHGELATTGYAETVEAAKRKCEGLMRTNTKGGE